MNNAKKGRNWVFEDYGQAFEKGDSVAAYIVSKGIATFTRLMR
jgi:hypothetical protein